MPISGQGGVAASSGGVQVSQSPVHERGESGAVPSVVVKREQSIDLLMSLRPRSSKHLNKFWVVTERMKLLGMSFPLPVAPHRKRKERERG